MRIAVSTLFETSHHRQAETLKPPRSLVRAQPGPSAKRLQIKCFYEQGLTDTRLTEQGGNRRGNKRQKSPLFFSCSSSARARETACMRLDGRLQAGTRNAQQCVHEVCWPSLQPSSLSRFRSRPGLPPPSSSGSRLDSPHADLASCGRDNADDARFCSACGAVLTAAPDSREQRKVVTVVFCDVTGSTALGESMDPEALRALLARYFERMRGIVESHGGTVEKFIGDAVMAVFGVPVAHEDDALQGLPGCGGDARRVA